MRAIELIAKHFDLEGRDLHRVLARVWSKTYKGEFGDTIQDWEADEIRSYLKDVDSTSFATLLRVAYQHGLADGAKRGKYRCTHCYGTGHNSRTCPELDR